MKKLFSVILAGVILSSLAATVSAHKDAAQIAEVPKVPSNDLITIDGYMDDAVWADAVKVEINQFNTGEENGTHGTAYMLWGDDTWYIFYDVTDAEIVPPSEDMQQTAPWTTDSVEMFFDFTNEHAADVYQFRVDCTGWLSYYLNQTGDESIYGPEASPKFGGYAVTMDKDGYNIEVAVNLKEHGLKEGDAIGLQLQINDMTAANESATTAVWNMAQSLGAKSWDADLYDYVLLGGALEVPEEPVEEAPVDGEATPEAPVTADAGIVAAAAVMAVAAGVVLSKKH